MGEHNEAYIKASVLITGVIMWKLLLLQAKINYFYLKCFLFFFSQAFLSCANRFFHISGCGRKKRHSSRATEKTPGNEKGKEEKKKKNVGLLLDSCRF